MKAIVTGDIIGSRKLINQEIWLHPLKDLLATWGERHKTWTLDRGDYFQIEIKNPENALKNALEIKALIRGVSPQNAQKKTSPIDVCLAIGIGEETFAGETIHENNGPAYIYSGERFDLQKKEGITMGIKSHWAEFDDEINLYLKLACTFMDHWTINSAQLISIILEHPGISQAETGRRLGIKQNSVSGRGNRAHLREILEVENTFRKRIKMYRHAGSD